VSRSPCVEKCTSPILSLSGIPRMTGRDGTGSAQCRSTHFFCIFSTFSTFSSSLSPIPPKSPHFSSSNIIANRRPLLHLMRSSDHVRRLIHI
jgi:hypothetical protein